MNMLDSIIQYVRSWFPPSEDLKLIEVSRKRRGSDSFSRFRSPKVRKVLSSMTNNLSDEDYFTSPNATRRIPRTIIINEEHPTPNSWNVKTRKSFDKLKDDDDVITIDAIKSSTEKKISAKKNGFEYITRFSSNLDKSSLRNGTKTKPIFKSPRRSMSRLNSPTLDYSIRLDDKKKYQMLLDNVALQNSFNNSSICATPTGTFFNRSKKMVALACAQKDIIDLTQDKKLSTKDRVMKVLDNFETETNVIEDSDSDVEILPNPPSPKPDIKVDPVNSLKTVVDTSKAAQQKWLIDVTKKHEQFVEDKHREIRAYSENSTTLNSINRDILIKSLTKRVHDSLAIKDAILPLEEEEIEVELPELSDEHLRTVKRAFSGEPNEILTKKFNLNVNRRDIQTLAGLNWLNDNVINFYMNLIIERGDGEKWPKSYAMNTFFYQKLTSNGPESLKRWTRRVDLFMCEFICVPIHLGMHWCMAIINLKEKTIKYYDSMGKSNNQCLSALKNYLEFEHQDKKGKPFSTKDFVLENAQDVPQQMNGSDCGMFSCTFAEFATRKAKFTFTQADMPYLRKKMVLEILTGALLIQ